MAQRLNYMELAPQGVAPMQAMEHYVSTGTDLEPNLLEMVRLLASLWNGCEYCVGLHSHSLKKHNETTERIAGLKDWRGSDAYTHREQAAFAWTEAITSIQDGHASDEAYAAVQEHFAGVELVNLTLAITSINSWNRMAIAFRAEHKSAAPRDQDQSAIDDDGGKVSVDE